MLRDFLQLNPTEYIATYTRNPAVIRMIGRITSDVYPLVCDTELVEIAHDMPYATEQGEATYHLDRYGEQGLFRGDDPAGLAIATPPQPLKERFQPLSNVRNALVITARVPEELR